MLLHPKHKNLSIKKLRFHASAVLYSAVTCSASAITLTFDSAVPGTIADKNGNGTGFMHRLPGTGGNLSANDTNLYLQTGNGILTINSTKSDINNAVNLGNMEAPGFLLTGTTSQNLTATALFRNVQVPNSSDQVFLYFGTNASKILRAGFHSGGIYMVVKNEGSGDSVVWQSSTGSFSAGHNITLTLSRTSGNWSLSWINLTTSTNGSSSNFSATWLDSEANLYSGVLVSSPNTPSFQAQLDSITVIPEPSPAFLVFLGSLFVVRPGLSLKAKRKS